MNQENKQLRMLLLKRLPPLIYILIVASIIGSAIFVINYNESGLINGLPVLLVIVSIFAVGFVSHYFEKALRSTILGIRNEILLPALKERIPDLEYEPDSRVNVAPLKQYEIYPFSMSFGRDRLRGVHNGQTFDMSSLTLCRMVGDSLETEMDGYAMSIPTMLAPEQGLVYWVSGPNIPPDSDSPIMPREWLARVAEAVQTPFHILCTPDGFLMLIVNTPHSPLKVDLSCIDVGTIRQTARQDAERILSIVAAMLSHPGLPSAEASGHLINTKGEV